MTQIIIAKPEYLVLLLLVPYIFIFAIRTGSRTWYLLGRFASTQTAPDLVSNRRKGIRATRWMLSCFAVLMIVLALAEPGFDMRTERVKLRNVDVVFLLDISDTMSAGDVPPASNRLMLAKRKIMELKQRIDADRIGLVTFSDEGNVICPLTIDHDVFDFFIEGIHEGIVSGKEKNISAGIQTAIDAFFAGQPSQKAIILFSDGKGQNRSNNAEDIAGKVSEQGIHLFVLGTGSTERTDIDGANGTSYAPAPDFEHLKLITSAGKGAFVEWQADARDVDALSVIIDEIVVSGAFTEETVSRTIDVRTLSITPFQIPLFISILLLCAEPFFKG